MSVGQCRHVIPNNMTQTSIESANQASCFGLLVSPISLQYSVLISILNYRSYGRSSIFTMEFVEQTAPYKQYLPISVPHMIAISAESLSHRRRLSSEVVCRRVLSVEGVPSLSITMDPRQYQASLLLRLTYLFHPVFAVPSPLSTLLVSVNCHGVVL